MASLEERQRELICDPPAREKRLQNKYYSYTAPISNKYAATANIDKGAGAALILAFGNLFSAWQELTYTHTVYVNHPLLGADHRILAGADIACCIAACGSAAVIWYLEVGWATLVILIWSGLELTRVGPMWLYDHAYSGKGFALPVFAFVLAIMSFRGARALRRGFPAVQRSPDSSN